MSGYKLGGTRPTAWRPAICRGVVSAPLVHSVSGAGGSWDEALTFGAMGAVAVVLVGLLYLGSKRRRQGPKQDRGARPRR